MKCPICQADVQLDAAQRPFCSKRCRLIDLGNWLGEHYSIAGSEVSPESDDDKQPSKS